MIFWAGLAAAVCLPAAADNLPVGAAVPLPGLAGIGAVLVDRNGAPVINDVLPHSPAASAGLKAQDTIVWVDYRDVAGMKLEDVVNLIRGPSGSSVVITVTYPGDTKPHTFTLTRAPIMVGP